MILGISHRNLTLTRTSLGMLSVSSEDGDISHLLRIVAGYLCMTRQEQHLMPAFHSMFGRTMKNLLNDWKLLTAMAIFLGFAPFVPEPHLIGKLRWVAGGAVGMAPMDWLDLLWHGLPFILLARLGLLHLRDRRVIK